MIALFFASNGDMILDSIQKDQKFGQKYFIDKLLQSIVQLRESYTRRKVAPNVPVHMNNSMYHNGVKITEQFEKNRLIRLLHPPDSPDPSPCDLGVFGISNIN
jgi:hypothetical protein